MNLSVAFVVYALLSSAALGIAAYGYLMWLRRPGAPALFYLGSGMLCLAFAFGVIGSWRYGMMPEDILWVTRLFFAVAIFNFWAAIRASLAQVDSQETFFTGHSAFWRRVLGHEFRYNHLYD